jgi:hypothetical protein
LKKGRRLQLTDEPKETQTPSRPTTRVVARRLPIPIVQTELVEVASQELDEDKGKSTEKDSKFRGMQQHLIEAQHVIA